MGKLLRNPLFKEVLSENELNKFTHVIWTTCRIPLTKRSEKNKRFTDWFDKHCQWNYCSYVFCYLHRKIRRQISVAHLHTFVQSQKYCSNIRLFFNVAVLALSNWMSIGSQPSDFYQHTWKEKEYLQFDSSHIKIPFPNKLDKSLGYLNNGTSRDSNLFKWIEQNFII